MAENTLDALMDLDPLDLSDQQIDEVVKFLRQQRMMVQHGVTPKKAKKAGEITDLSSVISALTLTVPEEKEERRF